MEKPNKAITRITHASEELHCIIQLWRAQRRILNQSLEDSIVSDPSQTVVQSPEHDVEPFCERLIDYISAGHFKVYQMLLQPGKSLSQDKVELVRNIYHNIEESTDQALSFNDKYIHDENSQSKANNSLFNDLQKLNRALAIRFVLEEQLVEILST